MSEIESKLSRTQGARSTAAAEASVPGKRTLVEQLTPVAVQRAITSGATQGTGAIHAAAARGISTPSTSLPHADVIQRAFGRHNISSVQAHVGGDASASADAMGASAYATGNHVVLGKGTDLRTEAHEAAHVIQQRGGVQLSGGVGQTGDAYEQHADEVAELVVQGKSSEALLDRMAGGGAAKNDGAVQHKLTSGLALDTEVVRHTPEGDVEGFKITKVPARFGGYTIEGSGGTFKNVTTGSIEWGTKANQAESRRVYEEGMAQKQARAAEDQLQKDLALGENYLGADYRRINPLLAAFEKQGYSGTQVRKPNFDYASKKSAVLADMKVIAIERKYAVPSTTESWDEGYVDQTYGVLRSILNVWDRFPAAGGGTHTRVFRGDSKFLYNSFPKLNPGLPDNGYHEGENSVSFSVTMPQILSTTYGDPKTHSYVAGKTVVWDISLPAAHEGKGLGKNNQSEEEMSFPVGTTLVVNKLLVRTTDRTQQAGTYGADAEVIVMASIA
jgi:hypothetical protein